MNNMRLISISLLGGVLLLIGCKNQIGRTKAELDSLLDSLQMEYAPDQRLALWDLSMSDSAGVITLSGEVDDCKAQQGISKALNEHFPDVENSVLLRPVGENDRLVNGVVNNSVTHLRRKPSSRTEMVSQALLGTPIRILKEENGWCLIQTPTRYLGWVNDSEVQRMEENDLTSYREAEKVIFTQQYGFAYTRPDVTSMPVADLVIGCLLHVISDESGFYQVRYPDGRHAWVRKDEVILAEKVFHNNITREGVIEVVLEFHGIPYLWGGTSSKAIDCSGLSSSAYFMNGILLPRDADQQSFCGKVITSEFEFQELKAGDLLFFGRKATEGQDESVTHVAIYIGDGEYIHAAGYRDRVSINSMDSTRENFIPEYPDIFIRTVRVIGEEENGFESITENEFYKEIISSTESI